MAGGYRRLRPIYLRSKAGPKGARRPWGPKRASYIFGFLDSPSKLFRLPLLLRFLSSFGFFGLLGFFSFLGLEKQDLPVRLGLKGLKARGEPYLLPCATWA